ncbi:hypothetical protein Tco_1197589 [Tanacetum coccineum]
MEDFNSRTTAPPRTKNMMTGKWTRMHGDCQSNKKVQYDHVWNILKNYLKWNAAEPIDGDNLQELFDPDPEERLPANTSSVEKAKDYRRKCGAAEKAYEAKREKELGML